MFVFIKWSSGSNYLFFKHENDFNEWWVLQMMERVRPVNSPGPYRRRIPMVQEGVFPAWFLWCRKGYSLLDSYGAGRSIPCLRCAHSLTVSVWSVLCVKTERGKWGGIYIVKWFKCMLIFFSFRDITVMWKCQEWNGFKIFNACYYKCWIVFAELNCSPLLWLNILLQLDKIGSRTS